MQDTQVLFSFNGDGYLVAKSCLTLCDPWTVVHQDPLSMGFPRQEYWSGLPFPSPRDFPDVMYFLFLAVLGLRCCTGFSLVAERGLLSGCDAQAFHRGGCSCCGAGALVVVAPGIWSTGSIVMAVAQVLNCSMACGIFLSQGWNPCLLSWQVDSLPLSHQGNPRDTSLIPGLGRVHVAQLLSSQAAATEARPL